MANALAVRPPRLFSNYLAGKQAKQDEDTQNVRNAFMSEQVADMPVDRAARQLQMDATRQQMGQRDQAFGAEQAENARGIAARHLAAVAQSADPLKAAQMLLANPEFQSAGKAAGLQLEQFSITPQDTADSIRSETMDLARALGAELEAQDKGFALSPGQARFDASGRQIAALPAAGPKPTDDELEYLRAQNDPAFQQYLTNLKKAGATSIDMRSPPTAPQGQVYVPDPDPNNKLGYRLENIPGAKDPRTEAQQKAGLLATRMQALSADVVDSAPTLSAQTIARIAQGGGVAGGIANANLTPEQQKHFNAARGWLAGVLRQDTGATIQPFEIQEYYPTFFPVPGDSKEVIAQKRKLREVTQNAIGSNGGVQQPAGALPDGVTEEDLNFTMQKHGLSREEVLQRLRGAP